MTSTELESPPMTSTPPDEKLGRGSMCKPDAGDISATEGVQTRAIAPDLVARLEAAPGEYEMHIMACDLCEEAATAFRSLTEQNAKLLQLTRDNQIWIDSVDQQNAALIEERDALDTALRASDSLKAGYAASFHAEMAKVDALTAEFDQAVGRIADANAESAAANAENAALTARVGVLEAALRPFADLGRKLKQAGTWAVPDDASAHYLKMEGICAGDFRRAFSIANEQSSITKQEA